MVHSSLCGAAILAVTIQAVVFPGPKQTDLGAIVLDAAYPRPTEPPHFHELKRRATESTETFLVASDNVCGYVSGLPGAAYTCDARSEICVFITSSATYPGAVGCCNENDCGFRITCYDSAQVSSSSLCNGGCLVDTFTAKCTSGSLTYCNTITFPGGTTDYFCNSLNISTAQEALTTYSGETGRTLSELVITATSGQSGFGLSSARGATSSRESTSTSSGPQPTDGGGGGGGGGGGSSAGAIAGGVVGGVAVIGIVILGVVFLLRRNRSHRPDPPAQQTSYQGQPPQSQQPGLPPMAQQQSPGGHQSFYGAQDPTKMGDQPPFQQGQPTPPLSQYSPQPQYGQAYMAPNQPPYPAALVPGQQVPDRGDATSPLLHTTDPNRVSQYVGSPTGSHGYQHMSQQTFPGYQPQQPGSAVHEAGGNTVGGQTDYNANHRGQMHELA